MTPVPALGVPSFSFFCLWCKRKKQRKNQGRMNRSAHSSTRATHCASKLLPIALNDVCEIVMLSPVICNGGINCPGIFIKYSFWITIFIHWWEHSFPISNWSPLLLLVPHASSRWFHLFKGCADLSKIISMSCYSNYFAGNKWDFVFSCCLHNTSWKTKRCSYQYVCLVFIAPKDDLQNEIAQ